MKLSNNITIEAYLDQKGIEYHRSGKEIVTGCLFNDCDEDSRGNEAHLYFNSEGQYNCKKCGAKGNLTTLLKHMGDAFIRSATNPSFDIELIEKCHREMPDRIRQYLNGRGITDDVINSRKLGYGVIYGQPWITIPIKNAMGQYSYFKLRQDPINGSDKITYPKNTDTHPVYSQIYEWSSLTDGTGPIVLCEGELDRLVLLSKEVEAVTGTHGAGTFKTEWVSGFVPHECVYICFDRDDAGHDGAISAAQKLHEGGVGDIRIVTLPDEVGVGGDITDYFIKHGGTVEDLLGKYATPYPERFDTAKFKPMTVKDVIDTLGLTIKHDEHNKVTALFCELSAYTDEAQFNIGFSAPSSTGKSFIPMEVAKLFPKEDVITLAYSSPTAFFHDSIYDTESGKYTVDLERKILIFMDQPHYQLLEKLRPLLSHDQKEILLKITDKNAKGGLKTKNIVVKGYPSVIFCTADIELNDQEATRLLLLSPEISQEKIREGVLSTIRKEADSAGYNAWLDQDPGRTLLKDRIRAIKAEKITDINITPEMVTRINAVFLDGMKMLKPRHQRDAKKLMSLVKTHALLNVWHRERVGSIVIASIEDVEAAIHLWKAISVSQELNLPPYLYDFYTDILIPLWKEIKARLEESLEGQFTQRVGLTRHEILAKHREVTGRLLNPEELRLKMLPMLETSGLITQEMDPDKDKRQRFVYLVSPENILGAESKINSVEDPGVDQDFGLEDYREYD